MNIKTLLSIAVLALAMMAFSQQGFTADKHEQTDESATTEAAHADGDVVSETGEAEKLSIMDTPLDGTSVKAFETGMEAVRSNASVGDYNRLEGALEYLLVFDLSANRSREKLYANLNGKTPAEIIDMPFYGKR
jgi:hypothetical protein